MSSTPEAPFIAASGYASSWQPVPAGCAIPPDAQMMNGQWLFPVFGCDSLDHTVDDFMAEIERLREELEATRVKWFSCQGKLAAANEFIESHNARELSDGGKVQ